MVNSTATGGRWSLAWREDENGVTRESDNLGPPRNGSQIPCERVVHLPMASPDHANDIEAQSNTTMGKKVSSDVVDFHEEGGGS